MRYTIVIEQAKSNFSAYVPELPGCVATGGTVKETELNFREAIRFHIEGLREDSVHLHAPTYRTRQKVNR